MGTHANYRTPRNRWTVVHPETQGVNRPAFNMVLIWWGIALIVVMAAFFSILSYLLGSPV